MIGGGTIRSVLITGISGSGGSYMADWLAANRPDVAVHGLSRWHTATRDHLPHLAGKVRIHEADLMDQGSVLAVLRAVRPDAIFHLASHANVRASFTTPVAVMANNVLGTTNLFEAIRLAELDPIVQHCSTSEVYGQVPPELVPIREDAPLRPVSPYAVSKAAQDLLAFAYFRSYGMRIVRTRAFTYVNPRRGDLFATAFARQIARIERGQAVELVHGNLDSVRTLLDVRDCMEAYWLAAELGQAGEVYNVGGTVTMSVGQVLEALVKLARVDVPRRVDPALLRPADVTLQVPCVDKFTAATGWKPRYSVEESLRDLLEHSRREVGA